MGKDEDSQDDMYGLGNLQEMMDPDQEMNDWADDD